MSVGSHLPQHPFVVTANDWTIILSPRNSTRAENPASASAAASAPASADNDNDNENDYDYDYASRLVTHPETTEVIFQGGLLSLGPAVANPTVDVKLQCLKLLAQDAKWAMADQGKCNGGPR
jgi:hypothetical protein